MSMQLPRHGYITLAARYTSPESTRNVHKYIAKIRLTYHNRQNNTSKWHWKPVETGSLSHGIISPVVARCVNLYLRMYMGVFVYIACRFRRCIPSRECEEAPRILAKISINCVYERMVKCWNEPAR
jgi:hypothetical protein